MDITEQIKPISYLRSHATEIVMKFDEGDNDPMIITQNGEAKMVLISIKRYQEAIEQKKLNEERMSFMKLLALGTPEIAEGKSVSEEDFLGEMDRD